jgi:uncharacterized protein (TIGR00251 family)
MSPKAPKASSVPPVPCRRSRNGVTVEVRVQPRASRLAVEGIEGDVLKVRLTAPPADGEANAQLVKLLAKTFGVSKGSLRIIKGETSRSKVVEVSGPVPEQFVVRE